MYPTQHADKRTPLIPIQYADKRIPLIPAISDDEDSHGNSATKIYISPE